jgi:hypothetical protein
MMPIFSESRLKDKSIVGRNGYANHGASPEARTAKSRRNAKGDAHCVYLLDLDLMSTPARLDALERKSTVLGESSEMSIQALVDPHLEIARVLVLVAASG